MVVNLNSITTVLITMLEGKDYGTFFWLVLGYAVAYVRFYLKDGVPFRKEGI